MIRSAFVLVPLALALAAGPALATVTVTDCSSAPLQVVNKKTVLNLPSDDVVIQCALMPLPGSDVVNVVARSIFVDGGNGGSVSAGGKNKAIVLQATGADASDVSVRLDGTSLSAPNGNGDVEVLGPRNVVIASTSVSAGQRITLQCTGSGCLVNATDLTTASKEIEILGDGTVTILASRISTDCPRDEITIVSSTGDVILSPGNGLPLGTTCVMDIMNNCPGPNCPLPIVIDTVDKAKALCADCLLTPNRFQGCIEANLHILAPLGKVDLSGMTVHVGEAIDIVARTDVDFSNASVDNCGPKEGKFTVNAQTCIVSGATLLDDQPETAPTLNCAVTGVATELGTCSSQR